MRANTIDANMTSKALRQLISVIGMAALACAILTATDGYCQDAKPSFVISISAHQTTFQPSVPIWINVKIENMSDRILLLQRGRAFGTDSGIIVRHKHGDIV